MGDDRADGFASCTHTGSSVTAVVDPAFATAAAEGHFPGDPLLPGSVLLALMSAAASRVARAGDRLVRVERAVFRHRVHPAAEIVVTAQRDTVARVTAVVHADRTEAATGRLLFEPRA